MSGVKLTDNFNSSEFTSVPFASLPKKTQEMIRDMAQMLQAIRNHVSKKLGRSASITIRSGLRTAEDYLRLQGQGSNPSATSDHYFGQSIPLNKSDPKQSSAFNKYGANYTLSTGAVDIVCNAMDTVEFYNTILDMKYGGAIKTGQCLLEKANTFWVHLANDPTKYLSASEISLRGTSSTSGIGISLNNGVNWTWMQWGQYWNAAKNAAASAKDVARTAVATVQDAASEAVDIVQDNPVKTLLTISAIGVGVAAILVYRNKKKSDRAAELLKELEGLADTIHKEDS
jgi:hypothetical protein